MKRKLLLLFIALTTLPVLSQQIEMFQQFNGRYDYTAFGNTLNIEENGLGNCIILTESSTQFNLAANQTFVSAMLYWSGSGSGDFEVKLNGADVIAERTFVQNFIGKDFFSAYADVTSIVFVEGNGTYTLSELDLISVIPDYCGNGTNYGGWSVIVIYEDPSLTLNQIGVFDGFEAVSAVNINLDIVLQNIDVLSTDLAKIGFLAWEGDRGLAVSETLSVNGNLISNPPLNPEINAFNGSNSYTNSNQLFNMDLDFYDIENAIDVGDTSIDIRLTSGQDLVIINNVISVVNSELPDATVVVENVGAVCETDEIEITYTINNINCTKILLSNTPIAFYADGILIGQSQTLQDIAIGEKEINFSSFTVPASIPSPFVLTVVVDDDATGNGVLDETNEINNDFEITISFGTAPIISSIVDFVLLDANNDGVEIFDLTTKSSEILNGQSGVELRFFETQLNADMGVNAIVNENSYQNISNPQTIYVRLDNQNDNCFGVTSFVLIADENLGVEQNIFNDLQLLPNPTTDSFRIQSQFLTSESSVIIYNMLGQQVFSEMRTPKNGNIILSVSEMNSGMYFLKLTFEGNTITKKFIKK